jgi:hypothetical protein
MLVVVPPSSCRLCCSCSYTNENETVTVKMPVVSLIRVSTMRSREARTMSEMILVLL